MEIRDAAPHWGSTEGVQPLYIWMFCGMSLAVVVSGAKSELVSDQYDHFGDDSPAPGRVL